MEYTYIHAFISFRFVSFHIVDCEGTSGFSEVYSVTSMSLVAALLLTDIWRERRWKQQPEEQDGSSNDAAAATAGAAGAAGATAEEGGDGDPRGNAVTSHFYVSGKKKDHDDAGSVGAGASAGAGAGVDAGNDQLKLLMAAGACFGVAFSCHHISAVLVVPALCWLAAAGALTYVMMLFIERILFLEP